MSLYYGTAYGYDMLEMVSSPCISSSVNFSGDITFSINQPGNNTYIVGKQSYISAQLNIVLTREDGTQHPLEPIVNASVTPLVPATNTRATPAAISVPYLCNNPAGALFQNMTCYVKGEQISNFQYAQSTTTLYRMLYETKEEQNTVNSTNAINPVSLNDIDINPLVSYPDANKLATRIGAGAGTLNNLFTSHMVWALKNNQFSFDKSCTNRINFQIPLPLFYSDELLHFGTDGKCEIAFNVSPIWANSLIQIAGSNVCTLVNGQNYIVTKSNAADALRACSITVGVTDLRLYLCRAHVTNAYVPRSITQTIALKQWSPYRYQLTAGQSNTILAPMKQNRRITHIIIAFTSNLQTPFKSTPTDFSSGFTINGNNETNIMTDGMSLIQNVSITIGGVTYPQAVYNLSSNVLNATPYAVQVNASNTNDQGKAFIDYTVFTDSIRDRNGSLLSFSQWQANQIYVFKLKQNLNTTTGDCYVTVNTTANVTSATNVVIMGLYDEYLTLKYDEYSRITSLELNSTLPLSE